MTDTAFQLTMSQNKKPINTCVNRLWSSIRQCTSNAQHFQSNSQAGRSTFSKFLSQIVEFALSHGVTTNPKWENREKEKNQQWISTVFLSTNTVSMKCVYIYWISAMRLQMNDVLLWLFVINRLHLILRTKKNLMRIVLWRENTRFLSIDSRDNIKIDRQYSRTKTSHLHTHAHASLAICNIINIQHIPVPPSIRSTLKQLKLFVCFRTFVFTTN